MPVRSPIETTRGLLFLLGVVLVVLPSLSHSRPWQNKEGSQFEGDLLGVKDNVAVIQRKGDFRLFRIPILSLGLVDQQHVGKLIRENAIGPGLTIPIADSLRPALKGHYGFDEKGSLGVDSSGSRSALSTTNDCKMDWSQNGLLTARLLSMVAIPFSGCG